MARARSAAGKMGWLWVGDGFAFSIMKNGIVNENYEQTHKEKIDYEKANMRKLKSYLKGFKQCSHDTQYCMEDPEQAFVEYASSLTDEAEGALPSDMIKNPKLSTSPVLFARSYPTIHPSDSINAIKAHSKEPTISQTSLQQPGMEIKTKQPEEPEPTLKDGFQDLHLNLRVLEVLAHAPIYNAMLDK
ncbi:hypothetical protein Tco_0689179 [Tanacetum coccineum]